jgi:protein ImuB
MRRVMYVWLPRFPIERLRPRRAAPQDRARRPFVLAASVGNQRLVSAVDAAAAGEGIVPGMPLADARALRPDLEAAEADPAGDAAALHRLAAWCGRYSPWTAPALPDGVWLDVTGCAHLHGGEDGLMAEAMARLARLGIAARAAIADTAGAAWAVARFGAAPAAAVAPDAQRAALAGLPVAALRLSPETEETLMRLGLRRIGDLYPLPRPSLVLRFGTGLALRLDQALGRAAEPLSPLPPPPLRWTRRRFAEPIAAPEDIRAAAASLLDALCRRLEADGEGARRLELTLYRVDGTPQVAHVGTARPSRDPCHLLRLFEERLGALDPGLGIEDMVLAATLAETQAPAQLALDGRAQGGGDDLAALVDRLAARLGADAVSRPLLVESHWPERAVRLVPPLDPARGAAPPGARRPVRFLRHPEPVEAVAPVPDDPPLMFRWRKVMHRVRRADGPERIAGEWWRPCVRADELRDYYRVEDQDGRRFWLYRAGLHHADRPARWFLHGVFA